MRASLPRAARRAARRSEGYGVVVDSVNVSVLV